MQGQDEVRIAAQCRRLQVGHGGGLFPIPVQGAAHPRRKHLGPGEGEHLVHAQRRAVVPVAFQGNQIEPPVLDRPACPIGHVEGCGRHLQARPFTDQIEVRIEGTLDQRESAAKVMQYIG